MRAQIVQHTGAVIAPSRLAHQPRRAVAVEHAAVIEPPQPAAGDEIAHGDIVRLEAMVVGGVEDHTEAPRQRLELAYLGVVGGPQRLLDQRMLAVLGQVREQLELGAVGDAAERRVVALDRNILQVAIIGAGVDRVDRGDEIGSSELAPLGALHSQADDDHSHAWAPSAAWVAANQAWYVARRSTWPILSSTSWRPTGTLPSCSQVMAAAMAPSTAAITSLPVAMWVSVA